MRYIIVIIILFTFSDIVNSQVNNLGLPIVPIWYDEFDNAKVDTLLWQDSRFFYYHTRFWPSGVREQQYYVKFDDPTQIPANNYVFEYESLINKDVLSLTATQTSITARAVDWIDDNTIIDEDNLGLPNLRTFNFRSAELNSRMKFKYGIYVIRFKMPKGCGFWPAFWLYSGTHFDPYCIGASNPPSYCAGDEIDFFEWESEHVTQLPANVHYDHQNSSILQYDIETNQDLTNNYHILLIEWQPLDYDGDGVEDDQYLSWYFDPTYGTYPFYPNYTTHHKFNYPMTLLVNNAVGGAPYGGFSQSSFISDCINGANTNVGAAQFPAKFSIDNIAVYYRVDCNKTIDICNWNPETDQSAFTAGYLNVAGNCNITVPGYEYTVDGDLIADGKDLRLIAGHKIILKPGFHAKQGSRVLATVREGCDEHSPININNLSYDKIIPIESIMADSTPSLKSHSKTHPRLNDFNSIRIYPNPTKDILNIQYPNSSSNDSYEVKLFDYLGQIVFIKKENIQSIDISSYPNGIYFLQIKTDNIVFREKIIKN